MFCDAVKTLAALVAVLLALLTAAATPLRAQDVVADLTTHNVAVTVDFAGAKVVLFGSVIGQDDQIPESTPDVIVVMTGPDQPLVVREKQRISGLWINANERAFKNVPGYYAVVSSRRLAGIASTETKKNLGIGFEGLKARIVKQLPPGEESAEFADGLIRVMRSKRLYFERPGGLIFSGRHLFRAEIELPSNVPLGDYFAHIYLFRDQVMTSHHRTQLKIQKRGAEKLIFSLAHEQPLIYGVVCVILAVASGLGAAAVFRRS